MGKCFFTFAAFAFFFVRFLFAGEGGEPLFVLTGASYRPLAEKRNYDVLAVTNRQTWRAMGDDAGERIISEVLSYAEKIEPNSDRTLTVIDIRKDDLPPSLLREFDASFERTKKKFAEKSFPRASRAGDRDFIKSVFIDMPVFRELVQRLHDRSFYMWPYYDYAGRFRWNFPPAAPLTWDAVENSTAFLDLRDSGFGFEIARKTVPPSFPEYRLTNGVAKVSARVLPIPRGETNFVPYSCSYDLMSVAGYSSPSIEKTDIRNCRRYLYRDDSSEFTLFSLPGGLEYPYEDFLSGNGEIYGFSTTREPPYGFTETAFSWLDEHFGSSLLKSFARARSYFYSRGKVKPIKLKGNYGHVEFSGFSFDGGVCAFGCTDKTFSESYIVLTGKGKEKMLTGLGNPPVFDFQSCDFVSSNGLVVAGFAKDRRTKKLSLFRLDEDNQVTPIGFPVEENRGELLRAMSKSGEVFAGFTVLARPAQSLYWIYRNGRHECLVCDREDVRSLDVKFISNDGEVAGGLARFTNGDTEPFVAKNNALVFINEGLPAGVRVLEIVGMLDDGSRLLCHGFRRGIGECGVVVDMSWE